MPLSVTHLAGFGAKRASAGGGGSVTVDLPATTQAASASGAFNGLTVSGWRFNTAGTVDKNTGGSYASDHTWCTPTGGTPGDSYWIRATLNSGTLFEGTTGSWLAMSSANEWKTRDTASDATPVTANLTIEIAEDSGGASVLDSQTYTLSSNKT